MKENKIGLIKAWYLKKRCYMKSRPMIKQIQQDGKKYLIIIMCGWRGEKWSKRFEIVSELDESCNPIPFSGIVVNSDQHYAHDTEQKIKKGSDEQQ